jgi:hypothetical protein
MNPFLERDVAWHDFHERFLILGAGLIGAQIRPNYVVRVDDHIFVHEVPDAPRMSSGRADLSVTPTLQGSASPASSLAVLESPNRIRIPPVDVTREAYLEILDRQSREVVTVVELLSPANKRWNGIDRAQYLAKRRTILASPTHLVEIDLLRGGEAMPVENRPACVYSVLVSRAEDRPEAGFWPLGLSTPLPTIPIPLRDPHADASLDLQSLLHRVYDEAGYEYDIYNGQPRPPLSRDEADWARQFVPANP